MNPKINAIKQPQGAGLEAAWPSTQRVFAKTCRMAVGACLALAAGVATVAQAKDCADEAGGAMAACFEARYAAADKELNRVYASALSKLEANEKPKLVEAQRAWIRYRDASLAFMLEANKETRSYGAVLFGNYKSMLVEKRVQELKFLVASPADPPVSW